MMFNHIAFIRSAVLARRSFHCWLLLPLRATVGGYQTQEEPIIIIPPPSCLSSTTSPSLMCNYKLYVLFSTLLRRSALSSSTYLTPLLPDLFTAPSQLPPPPPLTMFVKLNNGCQNAHFLHYKCPLGNSVHCASIMRMPCRTQAKWS